MFIGFPPHAAYLQRRESWLYTLLEKMLDERDDNHRPWLGLLDRESAALLQKGYQSKTGPKFAKVDRYHYRMAAPLWSLLLDLINAGEATWWKRSYKESLIPVVQFDHSRQKLAAAAAAQV